MTTGVVDDLDITHQFGRIRQINEQSRWKYLIEFFTPVSGFDKWWCPEKNVIELKRKHNWY